MELILACSLLLVACGGNEKPTGYPPQEVRKFIERSLPQLAREGLPPNAKVDCPKALKAEQGSFTLCMAKAPNYRQELSVIFQGYDDKTPELLVQRTHRLQR